MQKYELVGGNRAGFFYEGGSKDFLWAGIKQNFFEKGIHMKFESL